MVPSGWRWGLEAPNPSSLEEIREAEIDELFGTLVVFRVAAVPLVVLVGVGFVLLDPQLWRAAVVGFGLLLLGFVAIIEYVRRRRGWSGPGAVPANMLLMSFLQQLLVFTTGGISSPILPLVLPAVLVFSTVLGPRPALGALLLLQYTALVTMAAGPLAGSLPDPRLAPLVDGPLDPALVWTQAGVMILAVTVAGGVGALGLRRTFGQMVLRALVAQEGERLAHVEHARDLAALSGEIAHELKNPLASIKGLGALLARDLDGKPAERLGVLRGEVDRMQEIVQEFLDFSRPLIPLAQTEVDVRALADEVAGLEEGFARDRAVEVIVAGAGPVVARCDRRKVRQILVNLVMNAIEASPAGGEVHVNVGSDGHLAHLEVLDRGAGLPDGVAVFDAGVTTKAQGSGLGLPIARSLARQHGGDLDLLARGGGGARAVLRLPLTGAKTSTEAA